MPRLTKIKLVRPGVREILRGKPMSKEMYRRAKNVADQARSIAPVVTGEYRDSIGASVWIGKNRVRGLATARIRYAGNVEAKYRVLGRAFDAARGD